jgi:hypothetical protein
MARPRTRPSTLTDAQRERYALRKRLDYHIDGRGPTLTDRCATCGRPCRPAHRDRLGHTPPAACSTTCADFALAKARRADDAKEKPHGR